MKKGDKRSSNGWHRAVKCALRMGEIMIYGYSEHFLIHLAGQLTVAGVIVILFAAILYSGKGKPTDTKALAISALLVWRFR